ncbi:MAG: hypothetical protein R3C68_03055 [Myxococcota bacterium]
MLQKKTRVGLSRVSGIALASIISIVGAGSAFAKSGDAQRYQKSFEALSSTVVELDSGDADRTSAKEIEMIRTLIGQGQAFLASEKYNKIAPLLERADAIAMFVRAKQKRMAVESQAAQAETEANEADKKAEHAKASADAVENRYNELEAKGL